MYSLIVMRKVTTGNDNTKRAETERLGQQVPFISLLMNKEIKMNGISGKV